MRIPFRFFANPYPSRLVLLTDLRNGVRKLGDLASSHYGVGVLSHQKEKKVGKVRVKEIPQISEFDDTHST